MLYTVSVIVPIYNVEKYIKKCVHKLMNQSLSGIQYIFVDDRTPDNSILNLQEALKEFSLDQKDVTIVSHEINKGLATARNTGMELAKGEFIYHCDSDDFIEENALEQMYVLAKTKNLDVVYSDFYFDYGDHKKLSKQEFSNDNLEYIRGLLCERIHAGVWNKLYRKSLIDQFSLKFPSGNDMWEDMYFNTHFFSRATGIGYLDKATYNYNQININSLTKNNLDKKFSQISKNVNAIISHLKHVFGNKLDNEFMQFKLAAKQNYLYTTDLDNFKKWVSIYPESNRFIYTQRKLPIHLKMIGLSAIFRFWWLLRLWILMKKLKVKFQ